MHAPPRHLWHQTFSQPNNSSKVQGLPPYKYRSGKLSLSLSLAVLAEKLRLLSSHVQRRGPLHIDGIHLPAMCFCG